MLIIAYIVTRHTFLAVYRAASVVYACSYKWYPQWMLQFNYVSSLWTASAFYDVEFDRLAFFKGFEAFGLDGREMNKNVAALLSLDKTITLLSIKPFYFTLHSEHSLHHHIAVRSHEYGPQFEYTTVSYKSQTLFCKRIQLNSTFPIRKRDIRQMPLFFDHFRLSKNWLS